MNARTSTERIGRRPPIAALVAALVFGVESHVVLGADTAGPAGAGEGPPGMTVRLLGLRVFWVDPPGADVRGNAGGPGAATQGESQGRFAIPGEPELTVRVARVDPGRRDAGAVIGTRTARGFGTFNTLSLARLVDLPDAERDTARDFLDLRTMERRVYWEGAFALVGIRREEIRSVEAVGPALVKPPRAWADILRGALDASPPAEGGDRTCLGMGPLSLCLNFPRMIRSFAGDRHPRERSRLDVTRSLWDGGTSCGVVAAGRLLEYSSVTFRVRTDGRGPGRSRIASLPPFDLRNSLDRSLAREDAPRGPAGAPMKGPMDRPGLPPPEESAAMVSVPQTHAAAAPAALAPPATPSGRGAAAPCATATPGVRRGAGQGAFRARGSWSALRTRGSVCTEEESERRIPLSAAGDDRQEDHR